MKANGEVPEEAGVTKPAPLVVIVTVVALTNVFPLTVTGSTPQVFPLVLVSVRAGPFTHPHDTLNILPAVIQPEPFLTLIV